MPAHRQAQWQVGHGLLGLPNRTGYRKLQSPASRPQAGERLRCAACARRCAARPECQRSMRRRAGRWHGNDAASTGPLACTGRRLLGRKWVPLVRPLRQIGVTAWPCLAARMLLLFGGVAWPPATGVGVHLGGHGGRQRLRRQNEPADPSDDLLPFVHRGQGGEWRASGGRGAGAAGRTSTGATCAISASKRGSSGAQASPL